jgi:hypothetical protein
MDIMVILAQVSTLLLCIMEAITVCITVGLMAGLCITAEDSVNLFLENIESFR